MSRKFGTERKKHNYIPKKENKINKVSFIEMMKIVTAAFLILVLVPTLTLVSCESYNKIKKEETEKICSRIKVLQTANNESLAASCTKYTHMTHPSWKNPVWVVNAALDYIEECKGTEATPEQWEEVHRTLVELSR